MSEYGVVPAGFRRKPLPVLLDELQDAAVAIFGPGVIQTAQSPLGQLNGLFAAMAGEFQEALEDVYQSFDVDQAETLRLDIIAKLRGMARIASEDDLGFRLRITNQAEANIKMTANVRRLREIAGVSWVTARENRTAEESDLGQPAHSVAYAVIGGDDDEVGTAIYQMSVPGAGLYGNTIIPVTADGYCQQVEFIRPADVPIVVIASVRAMAGNCNCAPPTVGAIVQHVVTTFSDECGYRNGDTIRLAEVRAEVGRLPGVEVVEVEMYRLDSPDVTAEIETSLFERAVFEAANIGVEYVE
ncbi:MAG: hypothetical protein J0H34_22335 [Rhizobiales bacterium]|nr:hypothetical protein [Hyphomicrobiales bacterium]